MNDTPAEDLLPELEAADAAEAPDIADALAKALGDELEEGSAPAQEA